MVVAIARWLINPADSVWLVYRRVQLVWMLTLTSWALVVRLALRRGLLLSQAPRLLLLAQPNEVLAILTAWRRVFIFSASPPVDAPILQQRLDQKEQPLLVAVSAEMRRDPSQRPFLENLEMRDPASCAACRCSACLNSSRNACAQVDGGYFLHLRRPPLGCHLQCPGSAQAHGRFGCGDCVVVAQCPVHWGGGVADLAGGSGTHLLLTAAERMVGAPFFTVLKLRTMTVQPADAPAEWTQVGDQRITAVGAVLRRVRLDELPQLLNVINGEMSLIGPRPERPELEHQLERSIPHYRKRHWMRPGLSGWAQVCAPYASSIEDSDLKLSYDLYYLRHFSTWLDLVILFRTIKTVLKAGGR